MYFWILPFLLNTGMLGKFPHYYFLSNLLNKHTNLEEGWQIFSLLIMTQTAAAASNSLQAKGER